MKYQTDIALSYKDIFDDYDLVNPAKLIEGIPSESSLKILGYFLAQMHTNERDHKIQKKFLEMWSSKLPSDVQEKIQSFISKTERKFNFNFINNIGATILIEIILENHNDLEDVRDLTGTQEINLFKAYLWCNQHWTDKQLGKIPKKIKDTKQLISVIFPTQLPYMEILEFKDFRIQFLKAIYFFKFCENDETFNSYLQSFLKSYNLKDWQKYLENILSLYVRRFERLKTPSVLNIKDDNKEIKDFISQFCIDKDKFQKQNDFKSIREKPIYKIDNDNYLFLNLNFFVDKLFQAIQFEFFKTVKKEKLEYKGKLVKSFDTFRSIYAENISEKGIFYNTLKYSFEKNKYEMFDGDYLNSKSGEGEPDFIIRDKGKLYLIEYKDVIINANIKHSYSFEEIINEISIKMIANQKGKQKGVTQLLNTIIDIRNGKFSEIDKDGKLKDCIIYPIIVFTDFSFNIPGVNDFLKKELYKQIEQSSFKGKDKIKPLTLIDLDTFLKFQDLFRNKDLKLNKCLNDFHKETISSSDLFTKITTFNISIHNQTRKMDYDTPQLLRDEVESIISKSEATNKC